VSLFGTKIRTAIALGVPNLVRAIGYRVGVKLGLNPVRGLRADVPQGAFFSSEIQFTVELRGSSQWFESARLFSYWRYALTEDLPDWHANPFTKQCIEKPERDWWLIPDFDPAVGDIKLIWELSRFDWLVAFAQQAKSGDSKALKRLNKWLNDWCKKNPPYKGVNWKCGQEASIRVMHLAMASLILDQAKTSTEPMLDLIELHMQRIAPTVSYAIAQDNNHGTSEAAALFIGGSWLALQGRPKGACWAANGRKMLENRAQRLIGKDGSFSQYSLNYHRVMLDTFCMVEVWRKYLVLAPFSECWQQRARAASYWLFAMINSRNGDGPNLGANDGARLLQLTDTDYRDFRPSVQLSVALFLAAKAYSEKGEWNLPLYWLGLTLPAKSLPAPESEVFDQGGFALLIDQGAKALLRYPRFSFRPSQADALHLDFWLLGCNLLRDGGTYSYNTDASWINYFSGTESHNTVQFDDRDQMPRLSRFLFGDWLKTSVFKSIKKSGNGQTVTAGYKDRYGVQHIRKVLLSKGLLKVVDEISGFKNKAILRWRLTPCEWQIVDGVLSNGIHSIKVDASMHIVRYELAQGWESKYYHDKQPLPVLEIEVDRPGTLITEYRWAR